MMIGHVQVLDVQIFSALKIRQKILRPSGKHSSFGSLRHHSDKTVLARNGLVSEEIHPHSCMASQEQQQADRELQLPLRC